MSKRVPEIRFEGFNYEWEEQKLGSISNMYQPHTITGKDLLSVGYPVFGANGYIGFYSKFNHEDDQITISARGEKAGQTSYVSGPAWITGNSMVVNVDENDIDKYFLYADLSSHSLKRYITGGAQPQLTRDVLVKVPVLLPALKEQQKVGSFFKKLDNLIDLHQRKLDLLKEQKKGFLQKMFPQDGAMVPEVRFAGFTDDWEQRKFSDLYKRNLERNKDQFSPDRTISIATMLFKKEGNGAAENSLASYKVLREGDIAFEGHTNKKFAFGRFVLNDIGDGIMSPRFTTLRPNQNMPITFWKQYINYEPIMHYPIVNSTKLGTMMNELVVDEFLNQHILIPDFSEQEKIGAFFKKLDEIIIFQEHRLDLLKDQKKVFLQKMFV